jgi:hypothetical protein
LRKGCVKNCVKKQIVENQALREILYAFTHMRKDPPPNPHQTRWHDFCTQEPDFFYTFTAKPEKLRNRNAVKLLESQGFEAFQFSLQRLYAVALQQTCTFAKNIR